MWLSRDHFVCENRSITRNPLGVGMAYFASSGVWGATNPSLVLSCHCRRPRYIRHRGDIAVSHSHQSCRFVSSSRTRFIITSRANTKPARKPTLSMKRTPSPHPSPPLGGEGARRAGEGDSAWFMVPMRDRRTVEAFQELAAETEVRDDMRFFEPTKIHKGLIGESAVLAIS